MELKIFLIFNFINNLNLYFLMINNTMKQCNFIYYYLYKDILKKLKEIKKKVKIIKYI